MAEPKLIGGYLRELRFSLRGHTEVDDMVAEIEDHLFEACDRLEREGYGPSDAQQEALARFGSAALVSKVFASESRKGPAISTVLTRRAGTTAVIAPGLITIGAVTLDQIDRGAGHDSGIAIAVIGGIAFLFGLWGMRARHGGLGGAGRAALWLTLLAPAIALPFARDADGVLLVLISAAISVLSIAMYRARVLPRAPIVLLGCGAATFAATIGLFALFKVDGSVYGPLGLPIFVVGYIWCGNVMRRETHVDRPPRAFAST